MSLEDCHEELFKCKGMRAAPVCGGGRPPCCSREGSGCAGCDAVPVAAAWPPLLRALSQSLSARSAGACCAAVLLLLADKGGMSSPSAGIAGGCVRASLLTVVCMPASSAAACSGRLQLCSLPAPSAAAAAGSAAAFCVASPVPAKHPCTDERARGRKHPVGADHVNTHLALLVLNTQKEGSRRLRVRQPEAQCSATAALNPSCAAACAAPPHRVPLALAGAQLWWPLMIHSHCCPPLIGWWVPRRLGWRALYYILQQLSHAALSALHPRPAGEVAHILLSPWAQGLARAVRDLHKKQMGVALGTVNKSRPAARSCVKTQFWSSFRT